MGAAAWHRWNFAGTYGLMMYLPAFQALTVGRLGTHRFNRGWYIYVGSARGPGGVAARLRHHLGICATPHWHLDYLRPWTRPRLAWAAACTREHQWAACLGALPAAVIPLAGFGASDCRCTSHLIYFPRRPQRQLIQSVLHGAGPHDLSLKMINLKVDSFSKTR